MGRSIGAIGAVGLWFVPACDDSSATSGPSTQPAVTRSEPHTDGIESLDRVTHLAFEAPLAATGWSKAAQSALRDALHDVSMADVSTLPIAARVAAQNDLWGLWQQLREAGAPDDLQRSTAKLVMALAVESSQLPADDGSIPKAVIDALGPGPYHERATELAVLGHEWDYGLRRIFRFVESPGGASAMFSQLVAIDSRGQTHLTRIVGEIEQLHRGAHDGDIERATVFELDRAALRSGAGRSSLRPVDPIAHIPARGANHFLVAFDHPVSLRDVPCRQCHADDHINGRPLLPTDGEPAPRRANLLHDHPALSVQPDAELSFALGELLEDAS